MSDPKGVDAPGGSRSPKRHPSLGWRYWAAMLAFLVMSAFLLWSEHRAHFLGVLPWLILLACPLIHVFMHRGHDHGDHGGR